jgi:hypothetical protein
MAELSYRRHRFPAEIIQHAIWLLTKSPGLGVGSRLSP